MSVIFGIVVILILLIIGVIHFYWSFGGKWGFDQALPKAEGGQRLFTPKKTHSAIVAMGMLTVVILILTKIEMISITLPDLMVNYGLWFFAAVFMLRAIGDFKFVGLFKRVRQTNFGKLDSRYYSPLCLLLGILMILIETTT
ncbi:MAG: DUF3995 domain-containing protein [Cyclobacteriaceae bacterium]